ncbi:FmdB family zinc ribbon protein [Methylobacterium sp. JK268]
MPNYDYACDECGPFTAMRPMAQFRDPCLCPGCGVGAPRAFLGAPAIARINPGGRLAPAATEPSTTSPRGGSAAHPAGCGCCIRRMPLPGTLSAAGRVFTSHGPVQRRGQ